MVKLAVGVKYHASVSPAEKYEITSLTPFTTKVLASEAKPELVGKEFPAPAGQSVAEGWELFQEVGLLVVDEVPNE